MRIGTPYGFTSAPRRSRWPLILALGVVLGLVGGAIALWSSRESEPVAAVVDAAVVPDSGSSGPSVPLVGSGSDGSSGSGAPPQAITVKLTLQSTPSGADVYDEAGVLLGTTPFELGWPASPTPVTFELRLKSYKTKRKQVIVDGEMTVGVALVKAPPAGR
jgi:hypothetical protein